MSDAETSTAPRRSQRERKQATQFVSIDSSQLSHKRKHSVVDSESEREDEGSPESEDGEADGEEDYTAPKSSQPKKKTAKKAPAADTDAKPAPKKRGRPPGTGKPRAQKAVVGGIVKPRRGRPRKGAAEFDPEQVAKETNIANDNPLFNAVMNPGAALQSAAEDFLESMSHTPDAAQAELINCILRACGCNHTYTPEQVLDYDGVVSALDDLTEELKQEDEHVYPLTSKLPAFKPFRASLSELITRLITSAAALGQLYSTDLIPTLTTWVNPMSSSHMRSFRHTATVIALDVATALSQVAAAVEKEAEVVSRQKEGERKRKKGKGEPATAREKELESKAREIRTRREKLAEFIKEFVYGVFVHRYRDLDPNIRAECVHAMGLWFSKHPAHFIDGEYLRYVGWVLSDANTHVRLEAVRALASAYAQTEYIGVSALQHFTERFKPRLVEMAMSDTELSVRVAVVQVLQAIDEHGLLEDEQREKLCLLVFDEENKMRKAVGRFVKGVWSETVEERLVGRKPSETEKKRVGVKAFAMLLVQWGRALDKGKGVRDEEDEEDGDQSEGSSKHPHRKEVAALVGAERKSRTALAVEALWDEVEPVSDWETLLDILLLDHSAESAVNGKSKKGKNVASDSAIDEVWRLEEVEEGVLLEVLLASLRKTLSEAAGGKKGEGETVSSDITRTLIKGLPRLFVKYQTDPGRMSDVLLLPQMLNLDMYLEMRMMTAYSNLWDDVIKQFMSHSAPIVLTNAVATIRFMMNATSLSNTNSTKILELEEELSTALRDTIKGRDELELASFTEDEVISLAAICSRLATLAGARDMTAWMEEDEGGKQSSAWDIVNALAERGRLGYKEEESMVEQALSLLTLYIIWKARGLTSSDEPSPEEARLRERLKECRDTLLEKLLEFAIGTQSNTSDGVKRAAFQNLMNLHILFAPVQAMDDGPVPPTAVMPLTLDEETQYRCAGFIQAEIERYAEDIEELSPPPSDGSDDEADKSGEEEPTANRRKKGKKGSSNGVTPSETRSSLEREYVFMGVMTTFLRAIRAGAIHFQHSTTLLAHYGRLGPSFDLCAKVILDILREEGLYKNNGAEAVTVISHAIREAFQLYLDGIVRTEEHAVALAKLLAGAFLIRGAQLTVVRRIESQHVVNLHTASISWIWKRIAQHDSGNKKARNRCIVFFKLLTPLLTAIDARDSLAIKAHLDQVVAQAKVEIPATSKIWDPYRAYEKKLTASKEKGGKAGKSGKKGTKTSEMVTTDEEEAEAEEVEELMGAAEEVPAPTSRAKPKPKPRARRRQASVPVSDGDDDAHGAERDQPVTPKAKPRARPARKAKASLQQQQASSRSPSPLASPQMPSPSPSTPKSASLSEPPTTPEPHEAEAEEDVQEDQEATPVARRKRPRSEDDEEPEDAEEPAGPSASQETQTEAIQVKRKRVRH